VADYLLIHLRYLRRSGRRVRCAGGRSSRTWAPRRHRSTRANLCEAGAYGKTLSVTKGLNFWKGSRSVARHDEAPASDSDGCERLALAQLATLGCELFYALSARVGECDDYDHRFTDKYEQRLLDLRANNWRLEP
jgi:hypothetical protein